MRMFIYAMIIFPVTFASPRDAKVSMNNLVIKILEVSSSGTISVELSNPSDVPIKVWKDSNSWGAARWRVAIVRNGQLSVFYQNPNEDFTKNFPVFDEIVAGEVRKVLLDLNGNNWCGRGRCTEYGQHRSGYERITFQTGDVLVVTYDVPVSDEARELGVWYGVVGTCEIVR
jgi:hypothetical protein